ncbi:hypothetical protein [Weissella paramesenteroides]|uniref:hypothetical protein n=1 Tax=Weissella paramesenteroides TaxID=1249 RepID=UPI002072EFF3|nr:hypothetical protein [Weissella paramesenteroides]MCM6765881.1 hypothetical protein [Weissella paramesenteroides]MCM6767253.1 hypothetical protein [Weissella paramesenteroides]MCM6769977.1 hypothetical protein [Weissella paramesenteroides]MCM6779924.1 hypothetical protein [Weissella paramesenteroides]MCM6781534.1 hypothetical protein [Weissella paramesenteroides]
MDVFKVLEISFGVIGAGATLLGGLWWVLKNTIVTSINNLREDLREIKEQLKSANKVAQDHGERLLKLEVWKHNKFGD